MFDETQATASNLDEYQNEIDSLVSDPAFFERPYEEQLSAVRSVYLGPNKDGSRQWQDEDEALAAHKETVALLRQANDRVVGEDDYLPLMPPKPDVSQVESLEEKYKLLDAWEATALATARANGGTAWKEIEEAAEQQIANSVDYDKKIIASEAAFGTDQGTPEEGDFEKYSQRLIGNTATLIKGGLTTLSRNIPGETGKKITRALETDPGLPERKEIIDNKIVVDLPVVGEMKGGDVLRGLGSTYAFMGGGMALAATGAGTAVVGAALMGSSVRLTYADTYDKALQATGNPTLAHEAALAAMPAGVLDGLFDAAVVTGKVTPLLKKIPIPDKIAALSRLIPAGALGDALKKGFSRGASIAASAVGEGATEMAQDWYAGKAAAAVTGDPSLEATGQELKTSGFVGALGGAGFGFAGDGARSAREAGAAAEPSSEETAAAAPQPIETKVEEAEPTVEEKPTEAPVVAPIEEPVVTTEAPAAAPVEEPVTDRPEEMAPTAEPAELAQPATEETIETPTGKYQVKGKDITKTLEGKQVPFYEATVLTSELANDPDVPQFKRKTKPLTGEYDMRAPPILVWQRLNGELKVISGRHRFEHLGRTKTPNARVVIVKEADGFTVKDARLADVIDNMRDGQGRVSDYANVFRQNKVSWEKAVAAGVTREESKGLTGYLIGTFASPVTFREWETGKISDDAAAVIADMGRENPSLQNVGITAIKKGKIPKPAQALAAQRSIQYVMDMGIDPDAQTSEGGGVGQEDWVKDDPTIKASIRLSGILAELGRAITKDLNDLEATKAGAKRSISVANKYPALAKRFDVSDPEGLKQMIGKLRDQKADLFNKDHLYRWTMDPDLVSQVMELTKQTAPDMLPQVERLISRGQAKAAEQPVAEREVGNQGAMFDRAAAPASAGIYDRLMGATGRRTTTPSKGVLADAYIAGRSGSLNPGPQRNPATSSITGREVPTQRTLEFQKGKEKPAILRDEEGIKEPIHHFALPALVRAVRQLAGSSPFIYKADANSRGYYDPKTNTVHVNRWMARDPQQQNKTLAHEIGHLIDYAAQGFGAGSNILGKLIPLALHRKNVFGETKVIGKLLPNEQIKHNGQKYTVGVSLGHINVWAKNDQGKTRYISKRSVPDAVLDEYRGRLKPELQELFDRVRNYKKIHGPRPITEQYSIDPDAKIVLADPVIRQQAWDLSAAWRPMPDFRSMSERVAQENVDYRMSANELYADMLSALLNNAAWVKENFPDLYRAFQLSVVGKPDVQAALVEANELLGEPENFSELLAGESAEQQQRLIDLAEGRIGQSKKEREDFFDHIGRLGFEAFKTAKQALVENFEPLHQAIKYEIKKLDAEVKKRTEKLLRLKQTNPAEFEKQKAKLQAARDAAKEEILALGDIVEGSKNVPTKQWLYLNDVYNKTESELIRLDIRPADFHSYKVASRILNETTATAEWIKENPEETKEVLAWILEANANLNPSLQFKFLDEGRIQDVINSDLEGQDLVDAVAPIDIDLHTGDPKGKKKAALVRAAAKEENPNLFRLLNDGAFNVRRYMANPNGWDAKEAQKQIDLIEKKYGERVFEQMKAADKAYSDINWEVMEELHDAGFISPALWEQMKLNKYAYANFTVLRHFADNPQFDAKIHRQYGTFEEIGNTFVATTVKTALTIARSQKQKAINTFLNLLRSQFQEQGLDRMRIVVNKNGKMLTGAHLWNELNRIKVEQKKADTKEHGKSYLVEYRNGKPILWEIDDPKYQKMFNRMRLSEYNLLIRMAAPLSSLVKSLWTVFNPRFVGYTDRVRNKAREAILAFNRTPKIAALYFHLSPSLRKKSATAKRIAKEITEWAHGDRRELSQDLPYRDDILRLLRLGRIPFPHGRELARTAVANEGEEEAGIAYDENQSLVDVARAFVGMTAHPNSLVETGMNAIKDLEQHTGITGTAAQVVNWSLDFMVNAAQMEELRTKITGYLIEEERVGFGDASRRAELWYGAPRPSGGGYYNTGLEAAFPFWRVTAYAPFILGQMAKEEPAMAAAFVGMKALQLSWRVGAFSFLMAKLMRYASGGDDEDEERYKNLLDVTAHKLPEHEKKAGNPIPLAFVNSLNGDWRWWHEADPNEVQDAEWKVFTVRRPSDPDERIVSRYLYDFMKMVSEDKQSMDLLAKLARDTAPELPDMHPLVESAQMAWAYIQDENPIDRFYGQPVLPNELAKGGDRLEKGAYLMRYAISKYIPTIPMPKATKGEEVFAEKFYRYGLKQSGAFGLTNYGEVEASKEAEAIAQHERYVRRKDYPDKVKSMQKDFNRLMNMGKAQRSGAQQERYEELLDWKYSIFDDYDEEIATATETGNQERIEELIKMLDKDSRESPAYWRDMRPYRKAKRKEQKAYAD